MSTALWRSAVDTRHSGVSRVSRRTRIDSSPAPAAIPPGSGQEVRFLSELVAAHTEVRSTIANALSGLAAGGPDLIALRGELRRRLDQLLDAFLTLANEQDAMDALVPFVFFVDEQVEQALAQGTAPGGPSWPQLQRDLFAERSAEGGDVFYERASDLLAEATPRPLVIAAYLFCLKASFRGRLADEPDDVIDGWIAALAQRLPSTVSRGAVRTLAWHAPRRAGTYLVAAVLAVSFWHLVVSVWAYLQ